MSKKEIKKSENVADIIKNQLTNIGKKKISVRSNIHAARQWRTINVKAKIKKITEQDKILAVRHEMTVSRYEEIDGLENIRDFWTKKIKEEENIEQVDDEKIIHSMAAIMKGELDRYVHYSKMEAANLKRSTPSPDVTKVAQNIFYYLKDMLKMVRGVTDLSPGFSNPRAFILAETLNVFQTLNSNDKEQFVKIIDGTIKEKSEPTGSKRTKRN